MYVKVRRNLDKNGYFSSFWCCFLCRYIVNFVDTKAIGITSFFREEMSIDSTKNRFFPLKEMVFGWEFMNSIPSGLCRMRPVRVSKKYSSTSEYANISPVSRTYKSSKKKTEWEQIKQKRLSSYSKNISKDKRKTECQKKPTRVD